MDDFRVAHLSLEELRKNYVDVLDTCSRLSSEIDRLRCEKSPNELPHSKQGIPPLSPKSIPIEPIQSTESIESIFSHRQQLHLPVIDAALQAVSQGVLITDEQQHILFSNHAFSTITGYSRAEIIGRNCRFLQGVETNPQTTKKIRECLTNKQTFIGETINYRKDGSAFWNDLSITPVFNEGHTLTHFIGITRDITQRKSAEAKLARSEQQQALALHGADLGLWDWDVSTGAVVLDARWCAIFGFRPEELTPHVDTWIQMLHPQDLEKIHAELDPHLAGTTAEYQVTYRGRHKNGNWVSVLSRGKVVSRSSEGTPLRMVGTAMDITKNLFVESKLREAHERLQMATQASGIGIWEYEFTSDTLIWDNQMHRIYKLSPSSFFGVHTDWANIIHPDDLGPTNELVQIAMTSGIPLDCEFRILWPDGTIRHIHSQATVRRDENSARLIGTNLDITDQKNAQHSLLLAKEFAERTSHELHQLTTEAVAANRAKSDFLANMSHEIRTPMNGVLGMTELLLGTALTAEQEDFARTAYHSGEALLTLLNEFLDFTKIEAGKLLIESASFNPSDILYHVVDMLRPASTGKNFDILINIAPDADGTARGDAGRWRQIVINLVGNAFKFTTHGHILISLTRVDSMWVLQVSDTGIGIPSDSLEKIFLPFVQGDSSTTRRFGGTGLGLAISRRLAVLMDGSLDVMSTEGCGSTFTVRLPLTDKLSPLSDSQEAKQRISPDSLPDNHSLESTPSGTCAARLAGLRIFLIDDNAVSCQIFHDQLRLLGAHVETQTNPILALLDLSKSIEARFDAVIIDLNMPGMSGFDVASTLTSDPSFRTPLIALGVQDSLIKKENIVKSGFSGYLVRPPPLHALGDVVKTVIARQHKTFHDLVTRHTFQKKSPQLDDQKDALPHTVQHISKILLVEDNPTNQKMIPLIFKKGEVDISIAQNGAEALELIQAHTYDLVLMDCQMPVMDGYTATIAIRENEAREHTKRLSIIALTAHALTGDREKCLAVGMDDHLTKPIRIDQFRQCVYFWLKRQDLV